MLYICVISLTSRLIIAHSIVEPTCAGEKCSDSNINIQMGLI